jgi:hypothetical protein
MTAFNVVRFRVKPGHEESFVEAFRSANPDQLPGVRRLAVIRTGDNSFCTVGEWETFNHIVDARPMMIGLLDGFRHMLEDLGADLGVTDPVSGEALLELGPPAPTAAPKARRAAVRRRKAAAKPRRAAPAKRAKKGAKAKAGARKTATKKAAKKPVKRGAKKPASKRGRK